MEGEGQCGRRWKVKDSVEQDGTGWDWMEGEEQGGTGWKVKNRVGQDGR